MLARRTLELWVGLFVAAGLVAVGVLAFRVGNLTMADVAQGYRLEARFENIGGLKVKSPVTLAGVRVGRVTAIDFDPRTYQAVVTLTIDGRYRTIPTDTSASILTSGLLGEQYIGLDPGGDEQSLGDGDVIKLTQSALVLEKLVGQFLFGSAEKPAGEKQ